MAESIFLADGGAFLATPHARGPWDPRALHGGAPAALLVRAFERHAEQDGLRFARLGFELLRPVPFDPLEIEIETVRPGRRVRELAAELTAGGEVICRANALLVQEVPAGIPEHALTEGGEGPARAESGMPGPDSADTFVFALDGSRDPGFASTAMEMRWVDDPRAPGPARVWMRPRQELLPGEPLSPLARLAATADFGNGVSASLPFEDYLFINADLSIHLQRAPSGEWVGLDARTLLHPGGPGLAESVLHDERGPVGRAFQSLVVQKRG